MILLISANEPVIEGFTTALSSPLPLISFPTVNEGHAYLDSFTDSPSDIEFIVLDATTQPHLVAEYRRLRPGEAVAEGPLLAIISQPLDREIVLQAGADDYLLFPLLPAEVEARMSHHLQTSPPNLSKWMVGIHPANKDIPSAQILSEALAETAALFKASCAWLFSCDAVGEINLVSSHNLPVLLEQDPSILKNEAKVCLEIHQQDDTNQLQVIFTSNLSQAWGAASKAREPQEDQVLPQEGATAENVVTYLSMPLHNGRHIVGVLNLVYDTAAPLLPAEKRLLTRLGQHLGPLLDILLLQEEAQIRAVQNEFMVLMARTINENLELNTILALSLEQVVPLLNAAGGDIWLLSAEGHWLELVSSLNMVFSFNHQVTRRAKYQGLLGWVLEQGQLVSISHDILGDPRYDAEVDKIRGMESYTLLAAPLRYRDKNIGVLAVRNPDDTPFLDPDIVLFESIIELTASAITNAHLMQELREYAEQQRVLHEMTQQIANGLDLETTLNRVLLWVSHLFKFEIVLLWLVDDSENQADTLEPNLSLAATKGIPFPREEKVLITLEQSLVGWVTHTGQAAIVNNPRQDPDFDPSIVQILGKTPHSLMSAPMLYHDEVIGVISLYNKIEGFFDAVDLTLLSTVTEMVAVTIGNSRLHTETVTLMEEREHLYREMVQTERLATIGRLTSSLSHEMNNPIQAMQGALYLAKKQLDNPERLGSYLEMSSEELARIAQVVERMRQIHHLEGDTPVSVAINDLLEEAVTLANKELKRQRVAVQVALDQTVPPVVAMVNQLQLVFLNLILNLSDALGSVGGGQLYLCTAHTQQAVQLEFATNVSLASVANWASIFDLSAAESQTAPALPKENTSLSLSFSREVISSHGGTIHISQSSEETVCRIDLPVIFGGRAQKAILPTR